MNIEDIMDILAVDLIGVVPDDEAVVVSTNRGEPAVLNGRSLAGQAYRNIADRIQGREVPFLNLDMNISFLAKLKRWMGIQ